MNRVVFFLAFFLCLISTTYGQQRVKVTPIFVDDSFDDVSLSKLNEAVILLENAFNSNEFSNRVLNTKFGVGNFRLTSSEILEVIKSGMDNYTGKPKDFSIDLRIKLFDQYFGHGNFGITDMNTRVTRTHRCYILQNDVKCYASHLAHEYLHQIGFYDDRTWFLGTKTKSVPYKIGNIIDDIIGNDSHCIAIDATCTK
jgi:hypothetical protein